MRRSPERRSASQGAREQRPSYADRRQMRSTERSRAWHAVSVSKAFTSEETAETPRVVPPRAPLPAGVPNYVTASGLALLRAELAALDAEYAAAEHEPEVAGRLENLAALAQRRADLEARIASAEVVPLPPEPRDTIRFGATVTVDWRRRRAALPDRRRRRGRCRARQARLRLAARAGAARRQRRRHRPVACSAGRGGARNHCGGVHGRDRARLKARLRERPPLMRTLRAASRWRPASRSSPAPGLGCCPRPAARPSQRRRSSRAHEPHPLAA